MDDYGDGSRGDGESNDQSETESIRGERSGEQNRPDARSPPETTPERAVSNTATRRSTLLALGAGALSTLGGCLRLASEESDGSDGSGTKQTPSGNTPPNGDSNQAETPAEEGTATDPVDEGVRIGVIQPLSGPLGAYGTIAMRGLYTYFGYRGADIPSEVAAGEYEFDVGGQTYTLDVRDSEGRLLKAEEAARDMAGDVAALTGATSSASALAIANNVADEQEVPYLAGPATWSALTENPDNCSEVVFRGSETTAMEAKAGAKFVAEESGIDSVYIYYADYSYGEEVNRTYQRVLGENGVTVTGTQALPQGYGDDWPGQFQDALETGVDAVIGGLTVATIPAMLGAYLRNDYGFQFQSSWGTRLFADAFGTVLTDYLGNGFTGADVRDAGFMPFPTRFHWNQYDNPTLTEANEIHRGAYGTNVDMFTSGTFTNASAVVQAVEQGGSSDPGDIVTELTGMTVEQTLKGEGGYRFQEYNNQARSAMTLADLVPSDSGEFWDAPVQPSGPVWTYGYRETTISESQSECSLD